MANASQASGVLVFENEKIALGYASENYLLISNCDRVALPGELGEMPPVLTTVIQRVRKLDVTQCQCGIYINGIRVAFPVKISAMEL